MRLKNIYLLLLLTSFGLFSYAQNAQEKVLEFEKTNHKFDDLTQGKPGTHTFKFKNVSKNPVKLTKVKASCGCTTPKWTKEAIAPGAEGTIDVRYNAAKMGSFKKSITVWRDSLTTPETVLYISGKVVADPSKVTEEKKENPESKYTVNRGLMGFQTVLQNMGTLKSDDSKRLEFKVMNKSTKPMTITKIEADPYFEVAPQHKTLQPKQESVIYVVVDGRKMKDAGYFYKQIKIFTDDDPNKAKEVSINGTLEMVYSQEEMENAPKIVFKETSVNGGKIIEGEKFVYDFVFTNEGKSDLEITQAKASCGCTATAPQDKVVKPGETSKITATFNSKGRIGTNNKSITVKSNDLEHPTVTLKFTVEVVRDPFHASNEGPANK